MQRSRQLIYIITPAEFIRHIAKDLIEHAENNEGIASWIITHGGTAIKQPDVWKFWFDLISKPENPIWYIPFRQQPICLWAIWRNKGSIHDSSRPAKIADFFISVVRSGAVQHQCVSGFSGWAYGEWHSAPDGTGNVATHTTPQNKAFKEGSPVHLGVQQVTRDTQHSAKFIGTNANGKKDGNITNHAI